LTKIVYNGIVNFKWLFSKKVEKILEMAMKVLLINGSLRGENSASLKVARAFVSGIAEEKKTAGEDTEVTEIMLRDKDIDHCHGCFVCWKNTPGECCIHDDMDELRQLVMENDIIIEAFPLYFFSLPSKLKAFTDRMISYVQEYRGNPGDEENHRFLHNMRYPELQKKKLVLVSTCGYEVTDNNYNSVFEMFDRICGVGKYTTVLAPQGGMLSEKGFTEKVEKYLVKFNEAGHEYALNGCLSDSTWNKLQRGMLGHNTFEMAINMNWDKEGVGPYGLS
jgi:multimeric flavodoxin WrbA